MEQNQQPQQNQTPDIDDAELKMPEEQFGGPEPVRNGPGLLIPLLVVSIIVLAGVLVALVLWGEEMMGTLLGEQNTEQNEATQFAATTTDDSTAAAAEPDTATTEPDFDAIEAELQGEGFATFEDDLSEIETEIENDTQSTTTAE